MAIENESVTFCLMGICCSHFGLEGAIGCVSPCPRRTRGGRVTGGQDNLDRFKRRLSGYSREINRKSWVKPR